MRDVSMIILHCASTTSKMDVGAKEIRKWHVEERGWRDIGYHWVIRRDGTLEKGRDEDIAGAHCSGYNSRSIGICLVGGLAMDYKSSEDNFSKAQFDTLAKLIKDIRSRYPNRLSIHGHNEFANKDCPVFNVDTFLKEYDIER